jgi:hypothetical protein
MAQIFISYSRADELFIGQLAPLLEEVYKGHIIWYDQHIEGGDPWWEEILEAIYNSSVFIYLLSNDSLTSEYCQAEFREALRWSRPCLPVMVRSKTDLSNAPADLQAEIKKRNWIDMSGGFRDARTQARLYSAINRKLEEAAKQAPIILPPESQPTPKPIVVIGAKKTEWTAMQIAVITAVIAGIFTLAAAFGPPLIGRIDASSTQSVQETQAAQTRIAQVQTPSITPDVSLTETLQPSKTPTLMPTPNPTQIEETIQGQMLAIQTEAKQTIDAQETATSGMMTALAQQTRNAQSLIDANSTATAEAYTDTPTPDTRLTAQARLELTQTIVALTATAASWTDTPPPVAPQPTMKIVIVTVVASATIEATEKTKGTFTDSDPSDGGIAFNYPVEVLLAGGDKQAVLTVDNGSIINIYAPDTYAEVIGGQIFSSDTEALKFFLDRIGLEMSEIDPLPTSLEGELAATGALLERRNQSGIAYLIDVGNGSRAVVMWLTPSGIEPSTRLVEALNLITDTFVYTPPPPIPTEEA